MTRTHLIIIAIAAAGTFLAGSAFIHGQKPSIKDQGHGDPLNPKNLPIGDGKLSDKPAKGYLMPCESRFGGGRGAFRDGAWIHSDGTWDATSKPIVSGDVKWDNYRYSITVEGDKRKLNGNGLPDHSTGTFPIPQTDDAFNYDRNPNSIRQTEIVFTLPLVPAVAVNPSCVPMGMIGVMRSGVAIFNAVDEMGRDAVAHEIQDKCDGHPQREGQYHYHSLSRCLEADHKGQHSELFGYALDGFGIYGRYGEDGKELTDADLDECHGHTHEIMWDGKLVVMYHYHATREYPYSIGCFRGTPVMARRPRPTGPGMFPPMFPFIGAF
ncbi:MAG: YHYH protein [Acidobacteria bacterium]|nr:YHYH protein [Acidobacteriota bacterium]